MEGQEENRILFHGGEIEIKKEYLLRKKRP